MEKKDPYMAEPIMKKYNSDNGNFKCNCGDEVDKDFLSVHMNDCDAMQEGYGDLYNALNILIEDAPFMKTWNNVQALSSFFKKKLEKVINKVSILLKLLGLRF